MTSAPSRLSLRRSSALSRAVPSSLSDPALKAVLNGGAPIKKGAKGAGVKQVQTVLTRLGYQTGGTDGEFGENTRTALTVFQRMRRPLQVSGTIDKPTLERLQTDLQGIQGEYTDGKLVNPRFQNDAQLAKVLAGKGTLGAGTRGSGLKRVQQALLDMGFALPGGADGAYGAQSAQAIRNFQVHAGGRYTTVKPTGVLDKATLEALDGLAPAPGKKGQSKNLPTAFYRGSRVRVVVLKKEHRTYLFNRQGKITNVFPNAVATGTNGQQTDTGLKAVSDKLGAKAAANLGLSKWGDAGVFGPRLLDLSWAEPGHEGQGSGDELHGTNAPAQLGRNVSHGCIRHRNEDILKIFAAVSVGEKVAIAETMRDSGFVRRA